MVGCNPKRSLTTLHDALLGVGRYVGPGESVEAEVPGPSICEASVRAAIFSDGHAEGDPESEGELFARRRGAYKALRKAIELLAPAYTRHVPVAQIVDRLNLQRKSGEKGPGEAGGYNSVLVLVSQTLSLPHVAISFPPDNLGQKQQLPAIEDVMREQGISHDEARVIVLSKALQAWKSLLEGNLQPRE